MGVTAGGCVLPINISPFEPSGNGGSLITFCGWRKDLCLKPYFVSEVCPCGIFFLEVDELLL